MPTAFAITEITETTVEFTIHCHTGYGKDDESKVVIIKEEELAFMPFLYVHPAQSGCMLVKECFVPGLNWLLAVVFQRAQEGSSQPPIDRFIGIRRTVR